MKERELARLLVHADEAWPDCSARAFDAAGLSASVRRELRCRQQATRRTVACAACLIALIAIVAVRFDEFWSRPTTPSPQLQVTNLLRTQADQLERDAQGRLAFLRAVNTRQRLLAARSIRNDAGIANSLHREQAAAVALRAVEFAENKEQRTSKCREIVNLFPETQAARRAADQLKLQDKS